MKTLFFIIAFLTITKISFGQYSWNGLISTDYTVAANWSPARVVPTAGDNLSFNPVTPIVVDHVPNQTIGSITVNSGTSTVTLNSDNPANVLTVNGTTPLVFTTAGSILAGNFFTINLSNAAAFIISRGTFGIASGGNGGKIIISSALTLNGGILDFDVAGAGGAFITGSITYITGTFSSMNTGAINWSGTATYFHAFNGSGVSAIPVSIWSTGSTCSITGMNAGVTPPAISANNTFSNFTWDCASQSGDVDLILPATSLFINGTLSIKRTNGKYLRLAGASSGSITAGAYDQTSGGGNLMLQSASGTTTLTVNGAFNHSSGTLDGVGLTGTGIANLNLKGHVTKSGTWNSSSSSSAAQMNIEFSGTTVQNVNITGTWNQTGVGRSNIIISNTVSVALTSASVLKVYNGASPSPAICTISGVLSPQSATAFISYTGICTLLYSGNSLQTATVAEFPVSAAPANLTINNPLGVSFPLLFNRTIPGTLTMLSGNLAIGLNSTGPNVNNILTLNNPILANQLNYIGGFITTGTLSRVFPITGLPMVAGTNSSLFPFGTGANNRALNIFFPSGTAITAGTISVSHTPVVNALTGLSIIDNGVTLDKRTLTYWVISTSGGFDPGATNVSISAVGGNIGAIDNVNPLRLTDGVTANLGVLIPSTGTTSTPTVGKAGLNLSALNTNLYIGSDGTNVYNPLIIITFTWTGGGGNTNWTNSANWTAPTTQGYPNASTEIAIITNTLAPYQPTINSIDNISVYQLTVGTGMTLTMLPSALINIFDTVRFTGTAAFDRLSTFTYASSSNQQTVLDLPYGSLAFSGTASKKLPATITITGKYTISGASPDVTTNSNKFIYAGTNAQNIGLGSYYDLSITGNRGGNIITLGPSSSLSGSINIAHDFDVTSLTNFSDPSGYLSYTTVNYSSSSVVSPQTITGFRYPFAITNTGNGSRILDNRGGGPSGNSKYIIYCRTMTRGSGAYTIANSKVNFYAVGVANPLQQYFNYNEPFYDLEFSGDQLGRKLEFMPGEIYIAGKFTFSLINYKQVLNKDAYFVFNGTQSQTIPAFKTNLIAQQTPAFKYPNVVVMGGGRDVTLGGSGTDTIGILGSFQVPRMAAYNASLFNNPPSATSSIPAFSAGKGFIVSGSTVNFSSGSGLIPKLIPSSGLNNYNNIAVTSGTRILESDMTMSGNLSIGVDSATTTTGILSPATLKIGDAGSNRIFNVLGSVRVSETTSNPSNTAQLDMNTGTIGTTTMYLSDSLNIKQQGQITSTGQSNGNIVFKGILPQTYSSSSTLKNGFVNFQVGDGVTTSKLTLLTTMDLIRSGPSVDIPKIGTLTVLPNDSLDCGIYNVVSNLNNGATGNAKFDLQTNATLITSNTGGIEGAATSGTDGTIINDITQVVKTYHPAANYVFNGATTTPFPTAISNMANLTTNANVTLNKAIIASGTLDLTASTLTQAANNLQFSGLASTAGKIYADKNSTLTISGSVGTVGTLRFATGGNITGEFNITRGVTVPLGSDLTIEKSPSTGNLTTGTTSSILDINGNTLTINGTVSGSGALSGSNTSNLTLGNTVSAGTINFTTGKQLLKNLVLLNGVSATLGTPLDITGGTVTNSEGTVSVTGTSMLTSNGNLTIKSNANGTARVAQGLTTGGYIIGDVTVERFLSAKRAWRFLAAPTVGQTIKQSWQENQAAGVNPGTGFGTIITSNIGGWAAAGFDFSSPSASLLTYNAPTNTWLGATATNVAISAIAGNTSYMIFSRGDRSVLPSMGTAATPTTVLVRTKGSLFQGNLPAVTVAAGKFAAIGNNYAAAIDFSLLTKLNIAESFDVWDPKLGSLGAWVKFAFVNGWKPLISGGTYDINTASQRIESGQAFMVYNATASSGSVTLVESSKIAQSQLVSRPAGITGATRQIFKSNLYNISGSNNNMIDANVVVFSNDYSNEIDGKDALKMTNFTENFGIQKGNQTLAVEARQSFASADTIFFNFNKVKRQSYRLEFVSENFDNNLIGYLEDKFLDNTTLIQMNGTTTVDFTVTTDPASAVADRFRIVFIKALPLPVKFTSISATQQNDAIAVKWMVENEINISKYEVEKSTNGVNFVKINTTIATGTNNSSTTYNFLDINPIQGNNFYRIRSYNQSGSFDYSKIVLVKLGKTGAGISVYPNPVKDNQIGIAFNNMEKGTYQFRLINELGQTMLARQLINTGGNSMVTFTPDHSLRAGIYQLEIIAPDNQHSTIKVIVQ